LWDVQSLDFEQSILQTWLKQVIPAISQSPVSNTRVIPAGLTIAYAAQAPPTSGWSTAAGEWQ